MLDKKSGVAGVVSRPKSEAPEGITLVKQNMDEYR